MNCQTPGKPPDITWPFLRDLSKQLSTYQNVVAKWLPHCVPPRVFESHLCSPRHWPAPGTSGTRDAMDHPQRIPRKPRIILPQNQWILGIPRIIRSFYSGTRDTMDHPIILQHEIPLKIISAMKCHEPPRSNASHGLTHHGGPPPIAGWFSQCWNSKGFSPRILHKCWWFPAMPGRAPQHPVKTHKLMVFRTPLYPIPPFTLEPLHTGSFLIHAIFYGKKWAIDNPVRCTPKRTRLPHWNADFWKVGM